MGLVAALGGVIGANHASEVPALKLPALDNPRVRRKRRIPRRYRSFNTPGIFKKSEAFLAKEERRAKRDAKARALNPAWTD